MNDPILTRSQARLFLLLKHGLIGPYRFIGRQGILDFVKQAGCIQFDPIDICGRNAELVLQSRVKDFDKSMLDDLLYRDRLLLDYFDKNLAIIDIRDWPHFSRMRERLQQSGLHLAQINGIATDLKALIHDKGFVCSKDVGYEEKVHWYWGPQTKLARAALESLYFRGDLVIHHKKGSVKYYALADEWLPADLLTEPDPCHSDHEHRVWRVLRRIGAVGLIWNKPSDAWLSIDGLNAAERNLVFADLLESDQIRSVHVEGIKDRLYYQTPDQILLDRLLDGQIESAKLEPRTELLAPLDNLLWDRRLIKTLFDFDYKWEVYTPPDQRKFGYYVLPLLVGDRFVGRAELVNDRKNQCLIVKDLWPEPDAGDRQTLLQSTGFMACIGRFATFNRCDSIEIQIR
jgi:hypothetical protein